MARTGWLSVRIMWDHGVGGLVSQWDSTIKSLWLHTVTSQYLSWYGLRCSQDVKLQQPPTNTLRMPRGTNLLCRSETDCCGLNPRLVLHSVTSAILTTSCWPLAPLLHRRCSASQLPVCIIPVTSHTTSYVTSHPTSSHISVIAAASQLI